MFSDNSLLSISIIIATFNSERTLELCLRKVKEQNYPKEKIEIILADGGSTDKTLGIGKKFGTKIIKVNPKKQNAEYNKGIGLTLAKNELVLLLDHDNIMPHDKWLKHMILPFTKDKEIVGAEPLRFHYDKSMTLLDRYFSLLGGSDPVVYYLGKDSHLSWAFDNYNLLGEAKDRGNYYLVNFSLGKIPALGGNGTVLRRKILMEKAKSDPENFIHTDVIVDLVKNGYHKYAIVKDTIIHLTNNELFPFLARRKYFVEKYQFEEAGKRRYHLYDPKRDKLKLLKYVVFSITFVVPTVDAIRGFYKVRDLAWFLHPFMCLAFLFIYSTAVVKRGLGRR